MVTGMVQCGVVLRWADVQSDDAPRKVPEAFRGAVRWGGGGEEVQGRAKYTSYPSSHAAHQPHASQPTNQMEQSGEQPRKAKRSIAHRVDHSLFATTSSKQQAAPGQAQVHVHVRVEVKVEVEASRGRESITNHRGGVEGRGEEMDQQVRASGS